MLSRVLASGRRQAVSQPARGMATEQALRERINSVKNIKKITSAMKMVAVCKLRLAQENLDVARAFARTVEDVEFNPADASTKQANSHLFIGISSDRGLCGAINSSISRAVRNEVYKVREEGVEKTPILLIGEKCKQGLERLFKEDFQYTLSETSKFKPSTFKQTAELVDHWTAVKGVDKTSVFFQNFKSMISYITTQDVYWSFEAVKDDLATSLAQYEIEGESDCLQNFYEYRNLVKMHHYFAETETSTLSARMTAMDNSSTNATDMIDSLQLVLNRNRQAKITTELSEIISGAAASDEQ